MKDDSKDDNENTTVETVGNETEDKNKEENDTNSNTNDDTNNEASEQDIKTDTTIIERDPSIVYMTKDISPEALIRIYEALGREASGKVAVKVHMGEPGGNNYLKPELVKDLVLTVNGTFVDSNTAYGGLRASTAAHMQAAKDHGFTEYAPVDILDAEGAISLPIENGKHLTEDLVGSHYEDYDFYIILSHFKGHAMGGFGGAIKNMSIGFATPKGKNLIHTAGARETNSWLSGGYIQNEFLESMAEAAKAIVDDAGENIIYISIMNNLSVDCDCDNSPAAPEMADIGILASLDPVALDKACVDQVYAAPEEESASLRTRIESRNGTHTLDYAQEIGVGTMSYELVNIDE
ncbi:DUF362 domain-containing protein [Mobilitalea sibirica]|uniref:DUF362 domain-containing protein n=2 Tax=Mobilitalea sibirica TaxID=1462919 RepID=A0A8J7H0K2_9FIRM|nr:DUF362 domain-containing protein [Mobilitalea sibirica]